LQLKKYLKVLTSTLIIAACVFCLYLIGSKYIIKRAGIQGQWLETNERSFVLHRSEFETIAIPQGIPIDRLKIHIKATTPIVGGLISATDLDAVNNRFDNIRRVQFSCFHESLLDTTIECPIKTQNDVAAFLIVTNQEHFPPDRNDIFVSYSWHFPTQMTR
jgi:hypothetical protein